MKEVLDEIFTLLADKMLFGKTLLNLLKGHPVEYMQAISADTFDQLAMVRSILEECDERVNLHDLLEDRHSLAPVLELAMKHYTCNSRLDFLFSALKVKNQCFEIMLMESKIDKRAVMLFMHNLHVIYDAYEIIVTGEWFKNTAEKFHQKIDKSKGDFKQLNTRYYAVLNQLMYPVILTDESGNVTDINKAARKYFALMDSSNADLHILDLLDYHYISFPAFIETYKNHETKLLRMLNGEVYTNSFVKLSKNSYMYSLMPAAESDIRRSKEMEDQISPLTQSELIVYTMVKEGMTSKQIASELCISEETVKTHRRNIRRKVKL